MTQKLVLGVGMVRIGSAIINLFRVNLISTAMTSFVCSSCLTFEVIRPKEEVKEIE